MQKSNNILDDLSSEKDDSYIRQEGSSSYNSSLSENVDQDSFKQKVFDDGR